jgi:hypothetical protein
MLADDVEELVDDVGGVDRDRQAMRGARQPTERALMRRRSASSRW